MKIGKVKPIYKAGDRSDLGDCRPISVLPCFSKILEYVIYNGVYTYLRKKTNSLLQIYYYKLEIYVIKGNLLKWFESYLINRSQ